jgi:HK97 family phage portal protein
MGLLGLLRDTRSIENPNVPITAEQLALLSSFGPTKSGVQVNEQTALTFSAVFSAVRILSEALGSMEINVYKQLAKGKEVATAMPAHRLLSTQANEYMTAATFKETFFANLVLWGRAAAKIEYDGAGRPCRLIPFQSRLMRPIRINGQMLIRVETPNGNNDFQMEEVLYVPGLSLNGLEGLSPIAYCREAVAMGKAAEIFGAAFFGNGATVNGTLTHPGTLSNEAHKRLTESWNMRHQGVANANKMTILEEGMTYNRIGIPPEDAQFLQTRKFQVQEIARIYRIPPHMMADLDRSTNNNIEQQSLDFLTNTLATYIAKFEQECDAKLLPPGNQYYTSFNERSLLRGDIKTRMAYYNGGRQWGYLSVNDIREMEDLNDIQNGDIYLTPVNMADAADPQEKPEDDPALETGDGEDVKTKEGEEDPTPPAKKKKKAPEAGGGVGGGGEAKAVRMRRMAKAHARLFADAAERLVRKEVKAAERFDGRDAAALEQWAERFYAEHRDHMRSAFTVPAEALAEAAADADGLALDLGADVRNAVALYVEGVITNARQSLRVAVGAGSMKETLQQRETVWPAAVATELSQRIVDIVALKTKG